MASCNSSVLVSKFPSILRYALRATQDERKFTILHINTELLRVSVGGCCDAPEVYERIAATGLFYQLLLLLTKTTRPETPPNSTISEDGSGTAL